MLLDNCFFKLLPLQADFFEALDFSEPVSSVLQVDLLDLLALEDFQA